MQIGKFKSYFKSRILITKIVLHYLFSFNFNSCISQECPQTAFRYLYVCQFLLSDNALCQYAVIIYLRGFLYFNFFLHLKNIKKVKWFLYLTNDFIWKNVFLINFNNILSTVDLEILSWDIYFYKCWHLITKPGIL